MPHLFHPGADQGGMPLLLLSIAVRSALIVGVAASLALVLRRSPAALRSLVWQVTLALLLVLPLLCAVGSPWRLPVLAPPATSGFAPTVATAQAVQSPTTSRIQEQPRPAKGDGRRLRLPSLGEDPNVAANRGGAPAGWTQVSAWIGLLWALGTLVVLGRTCRGLAEARRMIDRSRAVPAGSLHDLLKEAQEQLQLRRPVRLVLGEPGAPPYVPMTCGHRWPCVLLTHEAAHWSTERTRAVLLHELAHIERRDWTWQLLARGACAVYWWNPLAWLAARALHEEADRSCDARVLQAGVKSSEYASHLLAIARTVRSATAPPATMVAMLRHSRLAGRLEAILSTRPAGGPMSRGCVVTASLLTAVALLPTATLGLTHRSHAPDPAFTARAPRKESPATRDRLLFTEGPRSQPIKIASQAAAAAPAPAEFLDLSGGTVSPLPSVTKPTLPAISTGESAAAPSGAAPGAAMRAPLFGRIVVGGYVQGEDWRVFSLDPATGALDTLVKRGGERVRLSPDRRTVAYERVTDHAPPALLVHSPGEGAPREVLPFQEQWFPPDTRYPVWSPDGREFLCSYVEEGADGHPGMVTYRVGTDGGQRTRIPLPATDWVADWSPDGQHVLTVSTRDGGGSQVYVMRTDGSEARRLTDGGDTHYWAPRFSPDGKRVLYAASQRPRQPEIPVQDGIWVIDLDGENRRRIVSEPDTGALGGWSPDGRHLIVIRWNWIRSERGKGIDGKTYRAEVMDAGGEHRRILAHFPWMARVGMPDWR